MAFVIPRRIPCHRWYLASARRPTGGGISTGFELLSGSQAIPQTAWLVSGPKPGIDMSRFAFRILLDGLVKFIAEPFYLFVDG
ncbi:hypothetical protein OH492_18845 [Vibrio chagasii]|nr:hypothetical protein [Vibrio chagasii]